MKKFLFFLIALLLPTLSLAATCVTGASGVAPTATLSFTAPTVNTDGTPVVTPLSFNLWQGTATGTETLAASGLVGSPISVTTGLKPNTTSYFYLVVKDGNGNLSLPSNEVCKIFPASVPGTVTITIS